MTNKFDPICLFKDVVPIHKTVVNGAANSLDETQRNIQSARDCKHAFLYFAND